MLSPPVAAPLVFAVEIRMKVNLPEQLENSELLPSLDVFLQCLGDRRFFCAVAAESQRLVHEAVV